MNWLKNNRNIAIIGGVVIAVLLAVTIWVLAGGGKGDGRIALDHEKKLREATMQEMERLGLRGETTVAGMERVMRTSPSVSREDVELFYRYPRSSRPLDRTMVDLIRPLEFHTALMPVFRTNPPMDNAKPDYVYQFTVQKTVIGPGDTFTATMEAYDAKSRTSVKPEIISAKILADDKSGNVEIGDAQYGDDGKNFDKTADDKIVTFAWKPPYAGRLYWGSLEMVVKFKIADRGEMVYKVNFESTPTPPAVFTGVFKESIKNGSLVIACEMDVKKAGHYVIEGNLFHNKSGEPTHWVVFNDEIEAPGKQFIELIFFGKIFHDKDLDGRFVLRNLRGFRDNIDYSTKKKYSEEELERINAKTRERNEPERWAIAPYMSEFVTESYKLDQFSDQVYDGEDKRQQLNMVIQAKN